MGCPCSEANQKILEEIEARLKNPRQHSALVTTIKNTYKPKQQVNQAETEQPVNPFALGKSLAEIINPKQPMEHKKPSSIRECHSFSEVYNYATEEEIR